MQLFATACHRSCKVHMNENYQIVSQKKNLYKAVELNKIPAQEAHALGTVRNFQSTLVLFNLGTLNTTEQFGLLDLQSQYSYFRVKGEFGPQSPVLW